MINTAVKILPSCGITEHIPSATGLWGEKKCSQGVDDNFVAEEEKKE